MKAKNVFIELVFWLHLPIVVLWFGLFAVPTSLWHERVLFHFWYIVGIMGLQFFWGLMLFRYTHKIDIICPITSLMQWLRGYPLSSRKNYGHSFIAELFERLKIKVSYVFVNYLLLVTLIIVTVQYFWR